MRGRGLIMSEKEELEKYKRLYEEHKAKVKELERQNSQLKVGVLLLSVLVNLLNGSAAVP